MSDELDAAILAAGGFAADLADKLRAHEREALISRGAGDGADELVGFLLANPAERARAIADLKLREPDSFANPKHVPSRERGTSVGLYKVALQEREKEKRTAERIAKAMKPKPKSFSRWGDGDVAKEKQEAEKREDELRAWANDTGLAGGVSAGLEMISSPLNGRGRPRRR